MRSSLHQMLPSSGSRWLPRGASEKQGEQSLSADVETIITGIRQQQNQRLHRIQQQPEQPAANAGQRILALFSAISTGSNAGTPAQQPPLVTKRENSSPLLEVRTWGNATGTWLAQATGPDARLCGMVWHPSAHPTWCALQQPADAMQRQCNRAAASKSGRA